MLLRLRQLTPPVVLLDEADVFLEQRSFDNLERNALVSGEIHDRKYVFYTLLTTYSVPPCDRVLRR
jgi:hypothetical protein